MATFEEKLRQKASVRAFETLAEIPDSLKLKWAKDEFKLDQTKRECLFVTYLTEDNKTVSQKYTATMYKELADHVQACGGIENLKTEFFIYNKIHVGKKGSFERLYPIAGSPQQMSQEIRHKR